jgi:hypothetical protein
MLNAEKVLKEIYRLPNLFVSKHLKNLGNILSKVRMAAIEISEALKKILSIKERGR